MAQTRQCAPVRKNKLETRAFYRVFSIYIFIATEPGIQIHKRNLSVLQERFPVLYIYITYGTISQKCTLLYRYIALYV